MLRKVLIPFLLFTTTLIAQDVNIAIVDPVPVLLENNNDFAFDLFHTVETPSKNVICSPFSIFSCLSMVYIGAEGQTETVMKKALNLSFNQADVPEAFLQYFQKKGDPRLNIANAVWASQDTYFLPNFLETLQESFQAGATSLNFRQNSNAAAIINEWIDNQTQGKITHLIDAKSITPSTRMILTNALYFKGKWASPFNPRKTVEGPFYTEKYLSIRTTIMNTKGHYSYFANDLFQVLSLPFEKEDKTHTKLACLIFLPKRHDNLSLSLKQYDEAIQGLKSSYVSIKLPKFTLRQRFNLNTPLKKLGMGIAFSEKANFSKIDGMRDLFISQVLHEAFFALDENGVVAAAATSSAMNATAVPPSVQPISFHANRPFIFLLVDLDTKGIYFAGKYRTP